MCTKPDNSYGQYIHNHHHAGHHKGHDTVGKQCRPGQLPVCRIKALFFFILSSECTDNGKSGQDLTGDQIDVIYQLLHLFEFRHCNRYKQHDIADNHNNCQYDNPAHAGACFYHLDDTSNTKNRRIRNHAQQQHRYHLDLLDIICTSRNQRRGREFIHFRIGKSDNLFEYLISQIATDSGSNTGGKQSDKNRYHTHQKCHADHLKTRRQKIRLLNPVDIKSRRFICGNCIGNSHRFYQRASHRIERFFHAIAHRKHVILLHLSTLEHRRKNRTDIHAGHFHLVSILIFFFLPEALQLHMHHLSDLLYRHVFKHGRILTGLLCHELFEGSFFHRTHLVIHKECNGQRFIRCI